jgi:hypothetical protein
MFSCLVVVGGRSKFKVSGKLGDKVSVESRGVGVITGEKCQSIFFSDDGRA